MGGVWMKTFKLISLEVVENDGLKNIELVDGLIINKEDEQNTWLIEVYTKPSNLDFFEKALQSQQEFIISAVISKKENDPVSFQIKARSVRKLDTNVSIMLQGTLKRTSRKNYAELLLEDLLDKGLSGDTLLSEFKAKLKNKPYLTPPSNTSTFTERSAEA